MPSSLARDPLVHFVLLGALLFAVDRFRGKPGSSSPSPSRSEVASTTIVLSAETKRALIEESTRSFGHPPTNAEIDTLVAQWIDEEVLYREGLLRSFDKDDPKIRRLIAQRMTFVIEQGIVLPKATDAELDAWFQKHASSKWQKPELIDFTQVFVNGLDTAAEARARSLLGDLAEKSAEPNGMGDVFSGGRRYRRRSMADLTESFGGDFTQGLADQPEGTWKQRRSRFGFHLVRVDKRTAASAPALSEVRAEVEEDFNRSRRSAELATAIGKLKSHFTIDAQR